VVQFGEQKEQTYSATDAAQHTVSYMLYY